MSHVCRRCGASCQGLRAVVKPEERAKLEMNAAKLGVDSPFSGPYLRQNWGTCVFYSDGCRLHAELGAQAKPSTCRQFPEASGVDPACFHPGEHASTSCWPEWHDLKLGIRVRRQLQALPFGAVLKPATLGSLTVQALEGLDHSDPRVPTDWKARLDWRARAAAPCIPHHTEPRDVLIGGAQLLQGLGRPHLFAAWVRLLRTLPTIG